MYFCSGCGKIFGLPKSVFDGHGFQLPLYEEYELCPFCSDTNIGEIGEEGSDDE